MLIIPHVKLEFCYCFVYYGLKCCIDCLDYKNNIPERSRLFVLLINKRQVIIGASKDYRLKLLASAGHSSEFTRSTF